MDIFKQKRYLGFTVILLVILNIATLTVLWLGRPEGRRPPGGPHDPAKEQKRIVHLLKTELGFDEQQTKQYLAMRREQREQVSRLQNDIRQIKREMFNTVLEGHSQPVLSDSLLKLAQDKMADLERLTFQYLLDLKKLCKPEQQDKLKILIGEFFRQNPPRGVKNNGPPPRRERP